MADIKLDDIRKAKDRINGLVRNYDMAKSNMLSKMTGAKVYLKCENFQKTGSFKIRGAANKIAKLAAKNKNISIVSASAGNHAQGVACASAYMGLKSTVVMPIQAPVAKIEATKNYGANVILKGECFDEAEEYAHKICNNNSSVFIEPFEDEDVICGQGTIGLEILENINDIDVILVPAGGGGLLSGVACAVKQINPKVKIYGVQAQNANAIYQSFKNKKYTTTSSSKTIADGIAVKKPGKSNVKLINKYVDDVICVDDEEISRAILQLLERTKIVVEPAGAVGVAALMSNKFETEGKKIACVISGGNIDFTSITQIIDRGLVARKRKIELEIKVETNQKSLKNAIELIMKAGAKINLFTLNSVSIYNEIGYDTLYLVCETKGEEDCEKLFNKLTEEGYEYKHY